MTNSKKQNKEDNNSATHDKIWMCLFYCATRCMFGILLFYAIVSYALMFIFKKKIQINGSHIIFTTMEMNLLDIVQVHINFRRLEEQIPLSAFYSNYSIWSWTNFDKSLFYHYCRFEQTQFFFLEIHQLEMTVTLLLCH